MSVIVDEAAIDEVITRSIAEIYPSKEEFKKALLSGKQLSFYVGIDPTADYVHLGHSTNYLLMERLNKLGHRIIVLVGDFTALIGDPSDKTSMRVQLTKEQVDENLKTFKNQIGKILDFDSIDNPIEFKFNSTWLSKLDFKDTVELASNFTIQQMVERDAFKKRLDSKKPLFVHEFLYPLMQGYDSVAMDVDAEIGGTDQTFNMLAGRTLLKRYKNKNKFVIATTLLENPVTGEKLMSKSLGTGVGLNGDSKSMFFKTMQLPDPGVLQCFVDCTRMFMSDIDTIKKRLDEGANPRDIKLLLAEEIVTMYHGAKLAQKAKNAWISEVSNKQVAIHVPTVELGKDTNLLEKLIQLNIVDSKSKARRLFLEGAIRIDGNKLEIDNYQDLIVDSAILTIGKKHTYVIKLG